MNNIAIIGAGNLGSRHLQGLSLLKESASIQIMDVSDASLALSCERFASMQPGAHLRLSTCKDIGELAEKLDLVIVATSSNVRADLTARLLKEKKVKYLILEKVLFQKLDDYDRIGRCIRESGVTAWVNCPRRTVGFYQQLAQMLRDEKEIEYCMSGAQWGLGCNAVHFLDMLALLSGSADMTVSCDGLDAESFPSKRAGFMEYAGTLTGSSPRCGHFALRCDKEGEMPSLITVRSEHYACNIREDQRKAWLWRAENKWETEEFPLDSKYQSELTGLVANEILEAGNCKLTSYAESVRIHVPYIKAMLDFINTHQEEKTDLCPIT